MASFSSVAGSNLGFLLARLAVHAAEPPHRELRHFLPCTLPCRPSQVTRSHLAPLFLHRATTVPPSCSPPPSPWSPPSTSFVAGRTQKVNELEAQLLIERKLAHQHADSKIADEQHQMKHQEEQNNALLRPALANRPLGSYKNFNDPLSGGWCKEQVNSARPLMENNILKPSISFSTTENSNKCIDHVEKENNPEMANKLLLPKRYGRAFICTMTTRVPSIITSR